MAQSKFVVFALFFFAIVGMAAAGDAPASAPPSEAPAAANNSVVGTLDGGATTTAAPVGGPIPASIYESLAPAGTPSSGATMTVRAAASAVTATVVGATVVASFFF